MSEGYQGPPVSATSGMIAIAVYLGAFAYGMAALACWLENKRQENQDERAR